VRDGKRPGPGPGHPAAEARSGAAGEDRSEGLCILPTEVLPQGHRGDGKELFDRDACWIGACEGEKAFLPSLKQMSQEDVALFAARNLY